MNVKIEVNVVYGRMVLYRFVKEMGLIDVIPDSFTYNGIWFTVDEVHYDFDTDQTILYCTDIVCDTMEYVENKVEVLKDSGFKSI